ncbi:hypothetical protein [Streptomyces sp. NPDC050504]|uniref:hypothetical protein n=1 Tax=Streptomyces sp. NPDC050504 TaxID=3365618 RepID=UPI0037AC30AF
MPRGRHRHSPPLHRILPPSAVAGAAVLSAAGAWFFADPVVLRVLAGAAAAAAVTGSVMMRGWDRGAGRRVAELTRARAGDQWKYEERTAELEGDLEDAREVRAKIEAKLRAKRVELAGLRGEHAELLRRYATAETERASALEGRRQLAIEVAAPAKGADGGALALPAATSTPTPEAYRKAAEALSRLGRAADVDADPEGAADAADADADPEGAADAEGVAAPVDAEPAQAPAAVPAQVQAAVPAPASAAALAPAPAAGAPAAAVPAVPAVPAVSAGADSEEHSRPEVPAQAAPVAPVAKAVPSASVVPYAGLNRRAVPQGSFDFFGTQKAADAIESVQNEDLADVVGEEALAVHRSVTVENRAVGKVIDLTAHDETEQLDVARLRAISS